MIPFRLVALGLTMVITVGYAIYKHYNSEQPQQHSYGSQTRTATRDDNEYYVPVQPGSSNTAQECRRRKKISPNCSICLIDVVSTDSKSRYLECGHAFHQDCIEIWFNTQKTCPNCRALSF